MATCYIRKSRQIWEAVEARSELLPYLGNPGKLALVLLKYTQRISFGVIDAVHMSNDQHRQCDL